MTSCFLWGAGSVFDIGWANERMETAKSMPRHAHLPPIPRGGVQGGANQERFGFYNLVDNSKGHGHRSWFLSQLSKC